MKKEWFIFKGTHHLGPFSLKEMEDYFKKGQITSLSLVWKEGTEKWEALSKVPDLKYLIEVSPLQDNIKETLKAPLEQVRDDLPPPLPSFFSNTSDELPPPIPLDALLDPKGLKKVFKTSNENKKSTQNKKLLLAILATLFVIVISQFLMNEESSKVQLRVRGVMPVYLDRLQEIASSRTSSFAMTMALSLDGKTLYAAANNGGNILSIIKLNSLPKRILGVEDVGLSLRGAIKDHLGVFDRMQLSKGAQFVPGEYNIEFTGRKMHFLTRNFRFLNDIAFFKGLNKTYTYQTTALIYSGTPREFEKKLMEYQSTLKEERIKPLTEKLERLETMSSLLAKTLDSYLLNLGRMKKPKEISNFEELYLKEISPVLQSLVVTAHEFSQAGIDEKEDVSSNIARYTDQVQLGKQLGELASDMMTETGKIKVLSDTEKKKLSAFFQSRHNTIKAQIDSNITRLKDRISKLSL